MLVGLRRPVAKRPGRYSEIETFCAKRPGIAKRPSGSEASRYSESSKVV